ncbi:MAG: cellulose biosynthesis cyclic di-GMP-binding regulatory protein BcsB, partial [Janthinobacterium lividum]
RADAWQPEGAHSTVSGLRSVRDIAIVDWTTIHAIFRWLFSRPKRPKPIKAGKVSVAAAAMALLVLGIHPAPARAQAPAKAATVIAAPPVSTTTHSLRLSLKDLQVKSPIRLAGTRGEVGIPFGMRRDSVVTGATLSLNLAHSPALLGDLSQLVVILNGEVVRVVPLTPDSADGQQLTIPINPALFLVGDNHLNIRLVGHYTRDCEDAFNSVLWASISNVHSFFDLTVQPLSLKPELSRLPAPFFDRYAPGSLNLPFVFAGSPSNGELEAAASLASWLGSVASYRKFAFKPYYNQLPKGDAIVFVTRSRPVAGVTVDAAGSSVEVMVNPADPSGQLLVIIGRDDRELKQAAAALATGRGLFAGQKVSTADARIPAYGPYGARRWMRTDRPVRLGELVDPYTLQGQGLPPGPLTTAFRAAPDLFFWPSQGAKLDVHYRYPGADWLDKDASRLDISINGQYLRTLGLTGTPWWNRWLGRPETTSTTSQAEVLLPEYNLFGQNELIFDYNLVLANQKRCSNVLPENVRTSVLPDSTIDLTQTHHSAHMPDLSTFAGAGYPFTIYPDLGETAVILQPNVGPDVVETFLEIMGRFGDSTGIPATALTVTRSIDREQLDGKDILVIGTIDLTKATTLFAAAPVRYADGRFQVTERSQIRRLFNMMSPYERNPVSTVNGFLYSAAAFTGITSFESPFSSGRTVVAVLAKDPVTLPQMIAGFGDVKVNAEVQGDLSVVVGDGMNSFAVGDGYWIGTLPLWLTVAYWLSQHPLLMACGGLFLAVLLSYPIYRLLQRQERKRLKAAGR